ncbi:MAG: GTPase Era [Flavobacteriales bacterium]|nr:MAG: GTPase Era [Flavobacteriales bacterium]
MAHKAGFVNIIGSPNVGKSTLMNALVGERISVITSKAQTTRHRILGIVNSDDFQVVFSDTPGIVKPAYKLHEGMMKFVKSALVDADVILFITDVFETEFKDEKIIRKVQKAKVPVLLAVNKIDISNEKQLEKRVEYWHTLIPKAEIIPISALEKFNVDVIFKKIIGMLPEGEPFYSKDALTDKPERFFVSEIIREKLFINYKQEIPYSCEVVIESFKESDELIKIASEIFVTRNSQKGILIGHKGKMLKKIGTEARKDIEKFFQKKVFLELFVKVNKNWRDSEKELKKYGYFN